MRGDPGLARALGKRECLGQYRSQLPGEFAVMVIGM